MDRKRKDLTVIATVTAIGQCCGSLITEPIYAAFGAGILAAAAAVIARAYESRTEGHDDPTSMPTFAPAPVRRSDRVRRKDESDQWSPVSPSPKDATVNAKPEAVDPGTPVLTCLAGVFVIVPMSALLVGFFDNGTVSYVLARLLWWLLFATLPALTGYIAGRTLYERTSIGAVHSATVGILVWIVSIAFDYYTGSKLYQGATTNL
ncbi:hypothetical protein GCM10023263_29310 [Phytohabitans rumicis]